MVPGEVEPLEVGEAVAGKDLFGEDLDVVATEVEHLRLGVDRVGDGDLALVLALNPSLSCKSVQKGINFTHQSLGKILKHSTYHLNIPLITAVYLTSQYPHQTLYDQLIITCDLNNV